jgi:polar amino acid transport system permease protein
MHGFIQSLPLLLKGLVVTVELAAVVILAGTLLGIAGGLALLYAHWALSRPLRLVVDLLRGLPLLVTIFVIFFGAPAMGYNLTPFFAASVALSLFGGAHMSEVFRGAIGSISRQQVEAGLSLGFRFRDVLRFVIIPQALRRVLPPWVNVAVEMVKATALASQVSLVDLLLASQQVLERTGQVLSIYAGAAAIYFLLNFGISRLGARLERRVAYYE